METDYYGQTILNPVGLAMVVVLGLAMLLLPRRYAVWPMIIMACFIAPAQRIVVLSFNFTLLRLLVLFGSARILLRTEWKGFHWNAIDRVLVAWTIAGTIAYTLLFGTTDALKFKLGESYDAIGMYFLFRCLIQDWGDVERTIMGFIVVSVPVLMAFMVEHSTHHNLFAFLGGVPAITLEREGRLRCQGAFAHPILAGCFWASLMPLMAALWWRGGKKRYWGVLGLVTSSAVVILCASSTPLAAVGFGAVGALMFFLRKQLQWVRWGVIVILVLLSFVMQNPVWHLITRADFAGGSTGYYRYILIDATIRNFGDWWALGIQSTESWGAQYGHYLTDITNQYILEAVRGGIVTLGLFITIIVLSFQRLGCLLRSYEGDRIRLILTWSLGISLFIHCTSFIAVSYFGQITMLWYLTLAIVASQSVRQPTRKAVFSIKQLRRPHDKMHSFAWHPIHGMRK